MSVCANCNIQQSNPSIVTQSSGPRQNPNAILIRRRYNPGAVLESGGGGSSTSNQAQQSLYNNSADSETSRSVRRVVNVASQSGFQDNSAERRANAQRANLRTQSILAQLLDIDSDIVQQDTARYKSRREARLSVMRDSKKLEDIDKKDTVKAAIDTKRQKQQEVVVNREVKVKKPKTAVQNRQVTKRAKSVGTELASSTSFQAKLSVLLQQNIATETVKIPFDVPSEFDGRIVWRDYIYPVRAQGLCGSCWAFASEFALSSRLAIYSGGKYKIKLSPAKMIFCTLNEFKTNDMDKFLNTIKTNLQTGTLFDFTEKTATDKSTYSCAGENLLNAWQYLYRYGVPENDCFYYGDEDDFDPSIQIDTPDLTNIDEIDAMCGEYSSKSFDVCPSTKKKMVVIRAGGFYLVPGIKSEDPTKPSGTEYNIRKEIYKWGPTTTGMMVYQDFIDWDAKGIYEYDGVSAKVGGHAVNFIGWGEENGKKYWIVRNSWGEEWGDKGYFKILRGVNMCQIEDNVVVGFPDIPGIRLFLDYPLLYQKEDFVTKQLWNIRSNGLKETTLEKLALGKADMKELTQTIKYTATDFPNFYKFIAGKVQKENFCVKKKKKKRNNFYMYSILILVLLIFLILI